MVILIAGKPEKTINYKAALEALGVDTFCSLNIEEANSADGLLLPGGGDINPVFFNQENCGSDNIDPELDIAQFAMLSEFVNAGKPVFGVCRGHQLINVYFGGTLIQDLPTAAAHVQVENVDAAHSTYAQEDSFVATLYGTHFATNSAHHQGIGKLGDGLRAVQWASDDEVIEAVCHETLPITSVQWHPERMCFEKARPDTVDGAKVLSFFVEQCQTICEQIAAQTPTV